MTSKELALIALEMREQGRTRSLVKLQKRR